MAEAGDIVTYRDVTDIKHNRETGRAVVKLGEFGEDEADLVIGTDGINSVVRRHLLGTENFCPRYSGHAWAGGCMDLASFPGRDQRKDAMVFTIGKGGLFCYSTGSRHIRQRNWEDPLIGKIIAEAEPSHVYGIKTLPKLPMWGTNRVVLVGDSAHAMSPITGQGASQSLEDAQTLALLLRNMIRKFHADEVNRDSLSTSVERTLSMYYDMRHRRVEEIAALGSALDKQHMLKTHPLAECIRYALFRTINSFPYIMGSLNERLYGWDVEECVESLTNKDQTNVERGQHPDKGVIDLIALNHYWKLRRADSQYNEAERQHFINSNTSIARTLEQYPIGRKNLPISDLMCHKVDDDYYWKGFWDSVEPGCLDESQLIDTIKFLNGEQAAAHLSVYLPDRARLRLCEEVILVAAPHGTASRIREGIASYHKIEFLFPGSRQRKSTQMLHVCCPGLQSGATLLDSHNGPVHDSITILSGMCLFTRQILNNTTANGCLDGQKLRHMPPTLYEMECIARLSSIIADVTTLTQSKFGEENHPVVNIVLDLPSWHYYQFIEEGLNSNARSLEEAIDWMEAIKLRCQQLASVLKKAISPESAVVDDLIKETLTLGHQLRLDDILSALSGRPHSLWPQFYSLLRDRDKPHSIRDLAFLFYVFQVLVYPTLVQLYMPRRVYIDSNNDGQRLYWHDPSPVLPLLKGTKEQQSRDMRNHDYRRRELQQIDFLTELYGRECSVNTQSTRVSFWFARLGDGGSRDRQFRYPPPAPSHTTTTPSTTTNATILQLPFPPPYRFSMASGSISELMTDDEYKRKVEHSTEPVVVTFLSPLDDKCQAVASKIEELSGEFTAIKFHRVDVRKHTMLSTALSNTELPIVVFVLTAETF
ncbi:hypothetical protein CNMCM7691_004697 [Aspergillus felis]|uniref:FAD-binding domain-containing protein n=1 Tax=Aspergillus felis TaxID=1287682 RepID=A0A8H6V9M1_9EURO|nr:hypothetical protein CNMCM7691_004697 [Aspergillus felis]